MPPPVPDRDKRLKYRKLRANLQKNGVVEIQKRGKGSHRMFFKVIEGKPVTDFVTCHSEGDEVSRKIVEHVREKFQISIDNFYNK